MAKKNKLIASGAALAMAAVLALTGTFAWQSISQQALNEARATVNPGARLHSDYNGENADVYVENFSAPGDGTAIYARVRLDEYMEIGEGAGLAYNDPDFTERKTAKSVVDGALIDDESTWRTHKPGDDADPFAKYWEWDADGGFTVYMPTFNKNKDSLKADINGTYRFVRDDGTHDPYGDYTTHKLGDTLTAEAVYDADTNDVEEDDGSGVTKVNEQHTAKLTETATVVTMQQWIDGGSTPGPVWVWDEDGWAYWAQAIQPGEATGLLLDGVTKKAALEDSWYYAINAVGQFVTADDLGWQDTTDQHRGFYGKIAGTREITENAEKLLAKIGAIPQLRADAVEITAANGTTFVKGTASTLNFSAKVKLGANDADAAFQNVKWSVEGNKSNSTKIDESTGVLTIAANEQSDALTVVATHTNEFSLNPVEKRVTVATAELKLATIQPGSAETVNIDGVEFYVLAKEGDQVLLLTQNVVGKGTYNKRTGWFYYGDPTDSPQAAVNDWLNSKATLKNMAVEKTLQVSCYHRDRDNYRGYDIKNTQTSETTGFAFLLSTADLGVSSSYYNMENYTYNNTKLPAPGGSWLAYDSDGNAADYFLRETYSEAIVNSQGFSFNYGYAAVWSASNSIRAYNESGNPTPPITSGIRPALWIDQTKLT